jgi:hypothetical protein
MLVLGCGGFRSSAAAKRAGIQLIDMGDPAAPHFVGTIDTPGSAYSVDVRDGYVFVTGDGGVMSAYRAILEN